MKTREGEHECVSGENTRQKFHHSQITKQFNEDVQHTETDNQEPVGKAAIIN